MPKLFWYIGFCWYSLHFAIVEILGERKNCYRVMFRNPFTPPPLLCANKVVILFVISISGNVFLLFSSCPNCPYLDFIEKLKLIMCLFCRMTLCSIYKLDSRLTARTKDCTILILCPDETIIDNSALHFPFFQCLASIIHTPVDHFHFWWVLFSQAPW